MTGELTIIKALRQAHGLKLSDLPDKGMSKWTYTFIENGQANASRKSQITIANMFGVDRRYLFDGKGQALKFTPKEVYKSARRKYKLTQGAGRKGGEDSDRAESEVVQDVQETGGPIKGVTRKPIPKGKRGSTGTTNKTDRKDVEKIRKKLRRK